MAASERAAGLLSRRQVLLASLAVGVLAGTSSPLVAGATPAARLPAPLRGSAPVPLGSETTLADGGVSPSALKWVQLAPQTLANWTLTQDTDAGDRFTLTPKNLSTLSGTPKRVLVL